MRLVTASSGRSPTAQVDPCFGRCPYFIITDTDTMTSAVISNPCSILSDWADSAAALAISTLGASVLLTGKISDAAKVKLQASGIEVVADQNGSVQESVESYLSAIMDTADSLETA